MDGITILGIVFIIIAVFIMGVITGVMLFC